MDVERAVSCLAGLCSGCTSSRLPPKKKVNKADTSTPMLCLDKIVLAFS
jgi:hypothetical protein